MSALRGDFEIVQSFVDFSLAWLEDRGYALAIDTDMSNWTAVTAATSGRRLHQSDLRPALRQPVPGKQLLARYSRGIAHHRDVRCASFRH